MLVFLSFYYLNRKLSNLRTKNDRNSIIFGGGSGEDVKKHVESTLEFICLSNNAELSEGRKKKILSSN